MMIFLNTLFIVFFFSAALQSTVHNHPQRKDNNKVKNQSIELSSSDVQGSSTPDARIIFPDNEMLSINRKLVSLQVEKQNLFLKTTPLLKNLLDWGIMNSSTLFVPVGFYMVMGRALHLAKPDSPSFQDLSRVLGTCILPGADLRVLEKTLGEHGMHLRTVLYRAAGLHGVAPVVTDFLVETDTAVVHTPDQLNAELADVLAGRHIVLAVDDPDDQVLINVLSFGYPWLRTFYRSAESSVFLDSRGRATRVPFVHSRHHSDVVVRAGRFMAARLHVANRPLPLAHRTAMDDLLEDAADVSPSSHTAWLAANVLRNNTLHGIAVYMVAGPAPDTPMSAAFADEVLRSFPDTSPALGDWTVAFPPFTLSATAMLAAPSWLHRGLLREANTDFDTLVPLTQVHIQQTAFLCVDEHGIQGNSETDVYLPTRTLPSQTITFDHTFYTLVVHQPTRTPLVIAKVDSVMDRECPKVV